MTQTIAKKTQKYGAFSGFPMELGTDFGMMGGPGAVLKTPSRPISNLVPEVTLPEQNLFESPCAVNQNWPSDLFHVLFVPLTRGKFATIDECDYPLVKGHVWCTTSPNKRGKCYAQATVPGSGKINRQYVLMHRLIIGACRGEEVDHRDNVGTNNQRRNLRKCDRSLNHGNMHHPWSASGFKGVVSNKDTGAFMARLGFRGSRRYLGSFGTAEEAAMAYDQEARAVFGEFAKLNFPDRPATTDIPTLQEARKVPVYSSAGGQWASIVDAAKALKARPAQVQLAIRLRRPLRGVLLSREPFAGVTHTVNQKED